MTTLDGCYKVDSIKGGPIYVFYVASLSGRVPMLQIFTALRLWLVRCYSYLTPLG